MSLTDAAARTITTDGWANESTGHVEAPTGAFSLIIIEPAEVAEVQAAFDFTDADVTAGFYVEQQDSNGNTHVTEYDTEDEARRAFTVLEEQFAAWDDEDVPT